MYQKQLSHQEIHLLLRRYILCLNKYFSALSEACQSAKQTSFLYTKQRDMSSLKILDKFIVIGKSLEGQLRTLQEEDSHYYSSRKEK